MRDKHYLTLREIQLKELSLLIKTTKFLDENNIRYFLDGGTLLGAVRHKGFIPWDDDIDIGVPRPDFEKFINLVKNNQNIDLNVTYSELKNSHFPFAKVIDKNVVLENLNDAESEHLWIDIFPFDGIEGSPKKIEKRIKKMMFISRMVAIRYSKLSFAKGKFFKHLVKLFLKPISLFYSPKRVIKLSKKDNFETSKFAGDIVWGTGLKNIIEKVNFDDYCYLEFEHEKFKAIKNYDIYLKTFYGDYMTLPPIEQRKTHNFKAYCIDEKVNNE